MVQIESLSDALLSVCFCLYISIVLCVIRVCVECRSSESECRKRLCMMRGRHACVVKVWNCGAVSGTNTSGGNYGHLVASDFLSCDIFVLEDDQQMRGNKRNITIRLLVVRGNIHYMIHIEFNLYNRSCQNFTRICISATI